MYGVIHLLAASAAFFSLAQAWPTSFEKRQTGATAPDLASQELQDISNISADLTALNNTLNTFTTDDPVGILEALKVSLQVSQLSSALSTAARTANQSSTFTQTDSENIATAVLNLEPVIFSTLNNIVVHKPAFATAILFVGDISSTVENDLVQQRELSREFADALATKLASPFNTAAAPIAQDIDNAFVAAIAAYSSCSGLICLPPIPI